MSYLKKKKKKILVRRFCLFIYIKHMGCNRVIQCHCLGNFASRNMMSLKNLYFEQYNGEVNSKLSFLLYDVIRFNERYVGDNVSMLIC